jgi:hypothetical protein
MTALFSIGTQLILCPKDTIEMTKRHKAELVFYTSPSIFFSWCAATVTAKVSCHASRRR